MRCLCGATDCPRCFPCRTSDPRCASCGDRALTVDAAGECEGCAALCAGCGDDLRPGEHGECIACATARRRKLKDAQTAALKAASRKVAA